MPEGKAAAPRTRDPDASRERILEAAIEIFGAKGFHETLVEEITRASNVSKGAFYLHFPTKQAMFLELLDTLARRLMENVEQAIAAEGGSVAKLDAALRTILGTFASHRGMARLVLAQSGAAGRLFEAKLFAIHSGFAKTIRSYLDEARRAGEIEAIDTETIAWIWFGAINELVLRWLYTPKPAPLEHALPTLRSTLLRSIGLPPDARPR